MGSFRLESLLYGLGWLLLVAHTLCAFHFEHHWSHAAAVAHTARQTAEIVGWNWGGGLYVNYVTIALWGVDLVVQSVCRRLGRLPRRWWTWLANGGIGFVMLNATVVFGPRGWRVAGPLMLLSAFAIRRSLRSKYAGDTTANA